MVMLEQGGRTQMRSPDAEAAFLDRQAGTFAGIAEIHEHFTPARGEYPSIDTDVWGRQPHAATFQHQVEHGRDQAQRHREVGPADLSQSFVGVGQDLQSLALYFSIFSFASGSAMKNRVRSRFRRMSQSVQIGRQRPSAQAFHCCEAGLPQRTQRSRRMPRSVYGVRRPGRFFFRFICHGAPKTGR